MFPTHAEKQPLAGSRFYGVDRRGQHAGLNLSESVYPPNLKMPPHSHEQAYLGIVLTGGYSETLGSKQRECGPLTSVFHPRDERHSVEFNNSEVRIFRIELGEEWQKRIGDFLRIPDWPVEQNGGPLASLALRLRKEFRQSDRWSHISIEGLALEMTAELARSTERRSRDAKPRWLDHAREILIAHFADPPTLAEVAESVGVHPAHLAREFRKHFSCTIGDFIRKLRVNLACRQIAESDAPLSQIALAAGFYDQSHFTNTFRRFTGISPAAYRKSCRGS